MGLMNSMMRPGFGPPMQNNMLPPNAFVPQANPAPWNAQSAGQGILNAVQSQQQMMQPQNPMAGFLGALQGLLGPRPAPQAVGNGKFNGAPQTSPQAVPQNPAPFPGQAPMNPYWQMGVGPQPGQTIADRQALWQQNRAASGMYDANGNRPANGIPGAQGVSANVNMPQFSRFRA